jgi:hypothetical protein
LPHCWRRLSSRGVARCESGRESSAATAAKIAAWQRFPEPDRFWRFWHRNLWFLTFLT